MLVAKFDSVVCYETAEIGQDRRKKGELQGPRGWFVLFFDNTLGPILAALMVVVAIVVMVLVV